MGASVRVDTEDEGSQREIQFRTVRNPLGTRVPRHATGVIGAEGRKIVP